MTNEMFQQESPTSNVSNSPCKTLLLLLTVVKGGERLWHRPMSCWAICLGLEAGSDGLWQWNFIVRACAPLARRAVAVAARVHLSLDPRAHIGQLACGLEKRDAVCVCERVRCGEAPPMPALTTTATLRLRLAQRPLS